LRHMQRAGGAAEPLIRGYGAKVAKVTQFHVLILSVFPIALA